ncbi:MAG: CCA tRNA nucleotidyltransferase [Acidimicrobiia bacterium]|nr:CCA tRNA nucleotidyltransferase [Acidimicrobiia bacterium]
MSVVPARLRPLLDPASPVQELAARLVDAGHECYLVGGSVRDALLDIPHEDVDLATDARPDVVEELVRGWADHVWLQGQRFGTVGCERAGVRMEITTFRAEVYRPESRKPEVAYADDVETDLSRRDFTVNAMALRLPEPLLVDPFEGAADLAARRLRTPLAPEVSFLDDPLRMMRAARFVAAFGLEPEPDLVAAVERLHGRLEIVSAERIRDELSKLLLVPDPSAGLWFLSSTGLSDEFLPELNALRLEQDPVHQHKDVLAHTIAVVRNTRPELRVRLAALLHDIGKPKTRSVGPGGVSFHHHEVVGARMAEERLRALKFPNDLVEDVTELVFLHLRIHTYAMGWTDRAVRRYVRDAGGLLDDLNHLQRSDCTTRNPKRARALARRMDELEQRIEELRAQEELDRIRPPLDGRQVMAFLGIEPGPQVGEALDHLLEARLDEGPMEEDEAYRRLAAWARERGIGTPPPGTPARPGPVARRGRGTPPPPAG